MSTDTTLETDLRYRDRLRILLILYFFSEEFTNQEKSDVCKIFRHEVKIQKLDFLIRYPSYLCYELILKMLEDEGINRHEIKDIIKSIFKQEEPQIRTIEMKKFLYGAWEKLDDKLAFLVAHGLISFESQRSKDGRTHGKQYYLKTVAKEKLEKAFEELNTLEWYRQRCLLIKKYFGDLTGAELKALQYKHKEYETALINKYIQDIEQKTIQLFKQEFQESL